MSGAESLGPGSTAFAATASDGVALRGARLPAEGAARGRAVLLQGRTEFLEKYAEVAAAFAARGFDVVSIDWRGQGGSERLLDDPRRGHVADFADYQRDLDALLAAPEAGAGESAPPRLMVAHSMGGAIGLRALAERPGVFRAAIFSAPMWGVTLPLWAIPVARLASAAAARLGLDAAYAPGGGGGTPYAQRGFEGNLLTSDAERFALIAARTRAAGEGALGGPTLGWLGAALAETRRLSRLRVAAPALVLIGGDEAVVSRRAIRAVAASSDMRLQRFGGGRHELFFETPAIRAALWKEIDAFLADQGF